MLAVEVTQVQMELAQHATGNDEGVLLWPVACVGRAQIRTVRATQQSPLLVVFEQQSRPGKVREVLGVWVFDCNANIRILSMKCLHQHASMLKDGIVLPSKLGLRIAKGISVKASRCTRVAFARGAPMCPGD